MVTYNVYKRFWPTLKVFKPPVKVSACGSGMQQADIGTHTHSHTYTCRLLQCMRMPLQAPLPEEREGHEDEQLIKAAGGESLQAGHTSIVSTKVYKGGRSDTR
jgi:integrase